MLGPECLDRRLADEGRRAPADGVDGDVGLRAAGAGIDVLHDGPVARNTLAALADLRPERRAFKRLELPANSDRAQVGQDSLPHIEIGREGQVLDLEAIGNAGLRHQLLGLLEVVFRYRRVLPLERVAIFRADPVTPGLTDPLRLLLHEELSIDREADGLTHALVAERTPLLVVAREHEPPRSGEVRVPPEAPIRHETGKELAGHAEREVELTGLQAGHARCRIPDALDHDRLGGRRAPPIVLVGLEHHLDARLLTDELVRSGTDRLGLEPVAPDLFVVAAGDDPPDTADTAVVEVHEIDERLLEVEDDRAVVDELDVLELVVEELRVRAFEVLVGPLHVGSRQRLPVVKFEAGPQSKGGAPEVARQLRVLGQPVGDVPIRHRFDHRVVDQVVVHHLRDGVGMLERVQPPGVQREVHRDRQRALRGASPFDLGGLDVELRQRPAEDRGILRGRVAIRHQGERESYRQEQKSGNQGLLLARCRAATRRRLPKLAHYPNAPRLVKCPHLSSRQVDDARCSGASAPRRGRVDPVAQGL